MAKIAACPEMSTGAYMHIGNAARKLIKEIKCAVRAANGADLLATSVPDVAPKIIAKQI